MSFTLRKFGVLAVVGVAALGPTATPAHAQRGGGGRVPNTVGLQSAANLNRINPNFYLPSGVSLNQAAYNVGVLGRAASQIPPYFLGYNPYPSVANFGPTIQPVGPVGPYSMATAPLGGVAGNPYLGTAALAADPYAGYGLNTLPAPIGGFGVPLFGTGTGTADALFAYGGYLRGAADLTAATGRYQRDIQTARIDRERSRMAALDTQRRRIMDEADYERMKPTAQDLRDRELQTELNRARRDPPPTEVWSGKSLNELLRSVAATRQLNRGPNIPLDEETLKNINVTDAASRANLGLLRDGGKLAWPISLTEAPFDEARKKLQLGLLAAVQQLKDKDPVERGTLKDLRANHTSMSDRLATSVGEMTPSQYIEARRYLNQLDDAIKALEDPRAVNNFNSIWRAKGGNVSELLGNMIKDGLRFAPATPGDEGAYSSLYQSLRAYEASLQQAAAASKGN